MKSHKIALSLVALASALFPAGCRLDRTAGGLQPPEYRAEDAEALFVCESDGFTREENDMLAAFCFDEDGGRTIHVTLVNKTGDTLLVLHKSCGVYYSARYEDLNGRIQDFQTGITDMDWDASMMVLGGQGPNGIDAACVWTFPLDLPFRYRRLLDLELDVRCARPCDIASAVSIRDLEGLCTFACVPVDIKNRHGESESGRRYLKWRR